MGDLAGYLRDHAGQVASLTVEHVTMVAVAVLAAVVIGVPLGIAAARRRRWERAVMGTANVLQMVPSLALFGFLIPVPFIGGVGATTAIVALTLYGLLPIVRGTHAGICGVDPAVREAGLGLGMTGAQLLRRVELPLAAPVILSGIRVATVISVGIATSGTRSRATLATCTERSPIRSRSETMRSAATSIRSSPATGCCSAMSSKHRSSIDSRIASMAVSAEMTCSATSNCVPMPESESIVIGVNCAIPSGPFVFFSK